MRLWHTDLIKYLPKQQLLGQWRELNSIYAKEDKHILINFIYDNIYNIDGKYDLWIYSLYVIAEMKNRGYKIKTKDKFENYFVEFKNNFTFKYAYEPFKIHMNEEYLKICCWNLYEKYIRGQQGFTEEAIIFIKKTIGVE